MDNIKDETTNETKDDLMDLKLDEECPELVAQLKTISPRESSHCRFCPGEWLARDNVRIWQRIGDGRFTTVWIAESNSAAIAVKVYRRGRASTYYYKNEIRILNHLAKFQSHPHIIKYLGTFAHVSIKSNGSPTIHPCIMFELAGDKLSKLVKYCGRKWKCGIPLATVKQIMKQLFSAIEVLHLNGIIHTDIKPGNILLNSRVEDLAPNNLSIKLADLGSATFANKLFSDRPGTIEYIAPEVLLDLKYSFPSDIWSAFITCFKLITGDQLFDVYGKDAITYGEDVDDEALDFGGVVVSSDDSSGDSPDDDKINYRLLLLMTKVLGNLPENLTKVGKSYFNSSGRLKNHVDIVQLPIHELLFSNCEMDMADCIDIETFLLSGLKYDTYERVSASMALESPWLKSEK